MADLTCLASRDGDDRDGIQVIIETPKGTRNKYAYDSEQKVFELKKVLPAGMAFLTILDLCLPRRPRMAIR